MERSELEIRIVKYSCGYTVYVNGIILLDCLSESDVDDLSIREIKNLLDI